jgi:hypothetical protein
MVDPFTHLTQAGSVREVRGYPGKQTHSLLLIMLVKAWPRSFSCDILL